eukprot:scaffold5903_cov165-Ochromonas_danica.AAC.12
MVLVPLWLVLGLSLFLVLLDDRVVHGQRNERDEILCRNFLTSPETAPILPSLTRDLHTDEAGEFSCELVLQDRDLPIQIRLTIHEGLFHLAQRHVEMGEHRGLVAAKHANIMSEILPQNAEFRLKAGYWALHPEVVDPSTAVTHFQEILDGRASGDERLTSDMRYQARQGLVKALAQSNDPHKAILAIISLLEDFPYDMEMVFHLKEHFHLLSEEEADRARNALKRANEFYEVILNYTTNSYAGFSTRRSGESEDSGSATWQIPRYDHLIDSDVLQRHIENREPFVMSFGSTKALSDSLGWQVSRWVAEEEYLAEEVKRRVREPDWLGKKLVMVETCVNNSAVDCSFYGQNIFLQRALKPFPDVSSGYINLQLPHTGEGPYNPPLHLLFDQLPLHKSNFFDPIRDNITAVTLWMGWATESASRPHRDALDNFYFTLQGKKRFILWDPLAAETMQTLSPTFAVHPNGLGFQVNVHYLRHALNYMQPTLLTDLKATCVDETNHELWQLRKVLQDLVSSENVKYDIEGLHFSYVHSAAFDGIVPPPSAEVDLDPGDVLFLPTGWFHHVTSFASTDSNRHLAVNIWWKPPAWRTAVGVEAEAVGTLSQRLLAQLQ